MGWCWNILGAGVVGNGVVLGGAGVGKVGGGQWGGAVIVWCGYNVWCVGSLD